MNGTIDASTNTKQLSLKEFYYYLAILEEFEHTILLLKALFLTFKKMS